MRISKEKRICDNQIKIESTFETSTVAMRCCVIHLAFVVLLAEHTQKTIICKHLQFCLSQVQAYSLKHIRARTRTPISLKMQNARIIWNTTKKCSRETDDECTFFISVSVFSVCLCVCLISQQYSVTVFFNTV